LTTCWGAPRRIYDISWNSLGAGDRGDLVMLTDTRHAGAREHLAGGLSRFVPGFLLPARQRTFGDAPLSERRG
jgi:hypothetical protein